MKYLQTILVAFALLLVFAFPVWGQETTSDPTATAAAATDDQYNGGGGDVNNPDKVIPDTTSKKPLPDTGGAPLLGLAIGVTLLVGAGFSILRLSTRRDP